MKVLLCILPAMIAIATGKCGQHSSEASGTPLIQLETYGCRGYCPVFQLTVQNNGKVMYEGKRNMVKMGLDSFHLSEVELKQLNKRIAAVNVWQYPEQIPSAVADAPMSKITVFQADKSHSVTGSIDRPEPLLSLELDLKNLAEAHGFPVKEGVNPYEAPANQRELIVKFKPEINPGNFLMQFQEIRLRIVRRISAENTWIIGYNPDQITEKGIISLLEGMEGVLEVKPQQ